MTTPAILVPIDFSPVSRSVLSEARRLAALLKAKLVLVHVVKPPVLVPDYPGMLVDMADILESSEHAAKRTLSRWCRDLEKAGFAAEPRVMAGLPGAELAREANRLRPRYIVIGSHGHSAFYEFVVGSTTRQILRVARCPVVVVASPAPAVSARKGKAKKA